MRTNFISLSLEPHASFYIPNLDYIILCNAKGWFALLIFFKSGSHYYKIFLMISVNIDFTRIIYD
jgi:hypothetical protein